MRRSLLRSPGVATAVLVTWVVSEIVVFALVVQTIGFGAALLAGFAALILGMTMLRRIGFNAVRNLRRSFDGQQPTADAMLDGSLAAIGAILLIVPGFITDLVGLALAAPSIRQWLAHRFAAVPKPGRQVSGQQERGWQGRGWQGRGWQERDRRERERLRSIELAPEDWRRLEDGKHGPDPTRRG